YLNFGGRIVGYFFDLDLALVIRLYYGVNKRSRSYAKRYVADDERFLIQLFNMRADAHFTAAFSLIIIGHIDHARCLKIGKELKLFPAQVFDRGINDLAKIMRKYF